MELGYSVKFTVGTLLFSIPDDCVALDFVFHRVWASMRAGADDFDFRAVGAEDVRHHWVVCGAGFEGEFGTFFFQGGDEIVEVLHVPTDMVDGVAC